MEEVDWSTGSSPSVSVHQASMALQLSQAPSTRGTPQDLHTATAATPVPFFCISLDLTRHDFMCLRNCDLPNASSRTPQSQVLQSAAFMAYVRTGGLVAAGHSVHLPLSRMVRHLGQRGYPGAFARCGLGMWLELDDPDATSSQSSPAGSTSGSGPCPPGKSGTSGSVTKFGQTAAQEDASH